MTEQDVGSGALLALGFLKTSVQEIGMPTFMDNSENVKRIAFDLVVDEVRKRPTFAARKSVRPDMISTLPLNHYPDRLLHSLVKIVAKSLRNLCVTRLSV